MDILMEKFMNKQVNLELTKVRSQLENDGESTLARYKEIHYDRDLHRIAVCSGLEFSFCKVIHL
ncbi:hypothetical protein EMIT07CA2_20677 [Brevibacillus sp. IT-7CA2]